MADIFNEIDEELRGDRLRKAWNSYNGLIIAAAVLIVVGVAGWRGWEYWHDQTARAASDKYLAALQLSSKGDFSGAEAALGAIAKSGVDGYSVLARLRAAGELSLAGDQKAALAAFDALARDNAMPTELKGLATIRAGYLALDVEERPALEARLAPLATGPWRHAAREILAVAAWKAGDMVAARKILDQMEGDADTPPDMSQRVAVMTAVVAAIPKKDPVVPVTPPAVKAE